MLLDYGNTTYSHDHFSMRQHGFVTVFCVIIIYVATPIQAQERGGFMEIIISFIISVMAGVVAYYICKWLDSNE